jgi:hypothetical protein
MHYVYLYLIWETENTHGISCKYSQHLCQESKPRRSEYWAQNSQSQYSVWNWDIDIWKVSLRQRLIWKADFGKLDKWRNTDKHSYSLTCEEFRLLRKGWTKSWKEGREEERKEEKKVISETVKTEQTEFVYNNAEFFESTDIYLQEFIGSIRSPFSPSCM